MNSLVAHHCPIEITRIYLESGTRKIEALLCIDDKKLEIQFYLDSYYRTGIMEAIIENPDRTDFSEFRMSPSWGIEPSNLDPVTPDEEQELQDTLKAIEKNREDIDKLIKKLNQQYLEDILNCIESNLDILLRKETSWHDYGI